jgi:hypothetical protein
MSTNKRTARIVGALFLMAMVTSLMGGIWLESVLSTPDYLTTVSANQMQVIIGVLLELTNAAAVVGIAVVLFPVLKKYGEASALGYVGFRVVEATILIAAVVSPLLLVTLSQEYVTAGASDAAYLQTLGTLIAAARAHMAALLVPIFFGLGALLLYSLLYRSRLVPRFISIWGFIAVVALLAWNLSESFGMHISAGMVFGLPIILNEIFLGFWLVIRGFSSPATPSPSI